MKIPMVGRNHDGTEHYDWSQSRQNRTLGNTKIVTVTHFSLEKVKDQMPQNVALNTGMSTKKV